MAPGASPLIPISIPQGSDAATRAQPPASDAGFLSLLLSGPAADLPQSPNVAGSASISSSSAPVAKEVEFSSSHLTAAPIPAPELDLSPLAWMSGATGPDPTALPAMPPWQSAQIRLGAMPSDAPVLAAPSLQSLRQSVLSDPEMEPVATIIPLQGTENAAVSPPPQPGQGADGTDKTVASSPVETAQFAAVPRASSEFGSPRSAPASTPQPVVTAAATRFDPPPAMSQEQPQPNIRAENSPAIAGAPTPPKTPSSNLAGTATPQKAAAPDFMAIARPDAGIVSKPAAVTATDALAAPLATSPGDIRVATSDLDGLPTNAATRIIAQGQVPGGPDGARPDGAKAPQSLVDSGRSPLSAAPVGNGAAPGTVPANPAPPGVPLESQVPRPATRQIVAPEAPSTTTRARPSAPEQPLPAPNSDRQGAVPVPPPPAPPQNTPPQRPVVPVAQSIAAPPAPTPGPTLASGAERVPFVPGRATPPQPPKASDPAQSLTRPGPPSTGPAAELEETAPTRTSHKDSEPLLARNSDAPPLSAAALREGLGAVPASVPPALARAEQIAAQITTYLATASNVADRSAPIEIALDPPELGQLRISVARGDDGVVVNLTIDRPETLDLMRRHAGLLSEEFQRQGLENTGFTFSGRDGGQPAPDRAVPDGPGHAPPEISPDARSRPAATSTDGTSLDIRI